MKRLIIGTAGHIDHGKSTLVKALTGIDPDRLKEEKERGITIDLGFAYLDLPGIGKAGVVDVPGHERFVRNMVAGAFGIDILLMVIAADEGVMPQTREHLDICQLLGIRKGIIVISKVDLVEKDFLDLVQDDVRGSVSGTFLENAPLMAFSAVTLAGLEELKRELLNAALHIEQRDDSGMLFMPVDRVFTMKGFGTVVTGTMLSGSLRKGDTVEILPAAVSAKVRGLQVHGEETEQAAAGQRTAINLQGVEKAAISRGDAVAAQGSLVPTSRLDCELRLLRNLKSPLRNRAKILFHVGTIQAIGTVLILDRGEIKPGEAGFARILLDRKIATLAQERFIARGFTTLENYGNTIGGGVILDPLPISRRRSAQDAATVLGAAKQDNLSELLAGLAREAGAAGLKLREMLMRVRAPEQRVRRTVEELARSGLLCITDPEEGEVIETGVFNGLKGAAIETVKQFHEREPLKEGISKEELKSRLPAALSQKAFSLLVGRLSEQGKLKAEPETVRLSGYMVSLSSELETLKKRIEVIYLKAGASPPRNDEIAAAARAPDRDVRDMLRILAEEGRLVRVSADLNFHSEVISRFKARLVQHIHARGQITTQEFKDMVGATRKFVIPLLEYFDKEKITIRVGEVRKLRGDG